VIELANIIETLFGSGVFVPAIWLSLGVFISWFLLSARINVPLTQNEIETLWTFHKQNRACNAKDWKKIIRKNDCVGFECECGHTHIQKKPLINFR
jgi:hypothetical protein